MAKTSGLWLPGGALGLRGYLAIAFPCQYNNPNMLLENMLVLMFYNAYYIYSLISYSKAPRIRTVGRLARRPNALIQ